MKTTNHQPEPDFHEIDRFRLDEEWTAQPRMFREHADLLAEAEKAWNANDGQLHSEYPSGRKWKARLTAFLAAQGGKR